MKPNKSDILQILSLNKPAFAQKYHLSKIALFGSFARNEAEESSDIDILVDFRKPIGIEIVDLLLELEDISDHKVDIVTFNAVKTRLPPYIEQSMIYV